MASRPGKVVAIDAHRATRAPAEGLTPAQQAVQALAGRLQGTAGALHDTRFALQRMRAVALLAGDARLTASCRETLQALLDELVVEVDRLATGISSDFQPLLDGSAVSALTFHGDDGAIALSLSGTSAEALGLPGLSIRGEAEAERALATLQSAIDGVSTQLAGLGGILDRLHAILATMLVASANEAASRSRIRDDATAAEVAQLSQAQLLGQPGGVARARSITGVLVRFPAPPSP